MRSLLPALKALLWTVVLAAVLVGVDRLLVGPPASTAWRLAPSIEAIPDSAGPVLVPSYLPESLAWPPARVFRRDAADPGWWIELGPREPGGPLLWIGSGTPPPSEMGEAAGCLPSPTEGACHEPWHALSRKSDGRTVWVVSTVGPKELARLFDGLTPPR